MSQQRIEATAFAGVYRRGDNLLTVNTAPGTRVYREYLHSQDGVEYREWDHTRSKLAAYLRNGGKQFPFQPDSKVLYLGAASGTTASHVADICRDGRIYCVEFSPRSFRDLVDVCERRPNMVPILADATRPDEYSFVVEGAQIVYQDIAQKNQASILVKNMRAFSAKEGMLCLKARSEDSAAEPSEIYRTAGAKLQAEGMTLLDTLDLGPWEKDHAMLVVRA
jgi:fibrillarin-like pre-rRNA processing protein